MLKLLLAPSAIALAVALSGTGNEGWGDQAHHQCLIGHTERPSGTILTSAERQLAPFSAPALAKSIFAEPNPNGDTSEDLLENLCIIMGQR